MLLLSKLEETLVVNGRRFDLSTNQYPGAVHPQGYQHLKEFRIDPFPTWVYQVDGVELEKEVFLVHGENTVVVRYELRALDRDPAPECHLEIRPLIAFRDYHSTTRRNDGLDPAVTSGEGLVVVTPYAGLPSLWFSHDAAGVEATCDWYYNFEYEIERERGLDDREDLFNPFVLQYALNRRTTALVISSTEPQRAADGVRLRQNEIRRRAELAESVPTSDPLVRTLAVAADQFIVQRGELKTVIAGYPWFSDWGRDTMIALPGLTLVTGREGIARDILLAFARSIDRGMLPNRFPDGGDEPEYNTVDATLWYFEAIRAYVQYTGDYAFVRQHLYAKLKQVLSAHLAGTRYSIQTTGDGLLYCGEPGVQLTWMDAKIGDWVVTPRTGKPVEVQALWYNALRTTGDLAARFGDTETERFLGELAALAKRSFRSQFWNEADGCLYDVVDAGRRDASIRPNQIFAVSLAHPLVEGELARRVVDVVARELWTPLGLRSLSPRHPDYRPRYGGGVWERDSAYHQGTVWPWLAGPFVTAYAKVYGREAAQGLLSGFRAHLFEGCLGQVSEIADASVPHAPRGCFAQAWSVAEILRAAVENLGTGERARSFAMAARDAGTANSAVAGSVAGW
jgi:predicted glycogen debranching enzyme